MKSKVEFVFDFPVQFLMEQYSSKTFYEARMEIDGITDARITSFEKKGGKTSFSIERHVEMRTDSAPKFIRKITDTLIHDAVLITTAGVWDSKKQHGSIEIKAQGVPVSVDIEFQFLPEHENSTRVKTMMEVNARIPLVGKQLEKFMLPKIEKLVVRDFEKAVEYFKML